MRRHSFSPAFQFSLAIALSLASSCEARPPTDAGGEREVRIGYLALAAQLPLFVATERGYLRAEGIRAILIPFASSNELVSAGLRGQVDVLAGAALNAVF